MNFYEFSDRNNAPYYALVAADSAEQAKELYEYAVCEFEGAHPEKITEKDARTKFEEGCTEIEAMGAEFEAALKRHPPTILLIDGDLI